MSGNDERRANLHTEECRKCGGPSKIIGQAWKDGVRFHCEYKCIVCGYRGMRGTFRVKKRD